MGIWDRMKGIFSGGDGERHDEPSRRGAMDPRASFMDLAVDEAQGIDGVTDVVLNPDDFSINLTCNGERSTCYLGNMFEESRDRSPEERREVLRRFLGSLVTQPRGSDARREAADAAIVPVLRTAALPAQVPNMLARPVLPFLVETVVIDQDDCMSYLMHTDLDGWGWDERTVFERARATMAGRITDADVEPYDGDAPYPMWHVTKHVDYEPSLLLVPGWLASFSGRVHGRPIATAPSHRMLVVSGDGDERAIERLAGLAEAEYRGAPRKISPALYTVGDDGRIVPLVLPHEHPQAWAVRRGHVLLGAVEYEAQKSVIVARHEKDGIDVFVARFTGMDHPEHGPSSWTTWAENVDTMLPVVDRVAFVGGLSETSRWNFFVAWADVERIAGELLEPVRGMFPPRMRTLGWPDEAMLRRLRERAI